MDKSVVFAVAGSGKTARIVEQLDMQKRVLLLTYTKNNYDELRRRIVKKFQFVPDNVTLRTYFTFLNSFCYRPCLQMAMKSRGVTFKDPAPFKARLRLTDDMRYLDAGRRVYHNRMSRLLDVKGCMPDLVRRVERYYDAMMVDEVQDFGGHDFNLLMAPPVPI